MQWNTVYASGLGKNPRFSLSLNYGAWKNSKLSPYLIKYIKFSLYETRSWFNMYQTPSSFKCTYDIFSSRVLIFLSLHKLCREYREETWLLNMILREIKGDQNNPQSPNLHSREFLLHCLHKKVLGRGELNFKDLRNTLFILCATRILFLENRWIICTASFLLDNFLQVIISLKRVL